MKPDQKVLEAVARLKNYPDFRLYTEHLQASLAEAKDLLVNSQPADVPTLQGRAKMLADLLKL
jgi:chromatin segregation and condensation protein Rec8/ScpA/Scc1 (kleisin family)